MSTERFDSASTLQAGADAARRSADTRSAARRFPPFPRDARRRRLHRRRARSASRFAMPPARARRPARSPPRIAEALDEVSEHSERDTVRAFARLASGRAGAETDAMIEDILPSIEDCHDCADFSLVPLIWCAHGLGRATSAPRRRARIDAAILGYRYWMDEPGNDVQWYFSENHALLFHTAAYLAGHLLPDAHLRPLRPQGRGTARSRARRGCAPGSTISRLGDGRVQLRALFPDRSQGPDGAGGARPRRRHRRAGQGGRSCGSARSSRARRITACSPPRRAAPTSTRCCAGRSLELSGIARLLWGKGWYGRRVHALPQLAVCLRDHGLVCPRSCRRSPTTRRRRHQEWRFAQGQDRFAALYHYKGRAFRHGLGAHYRWNEWGYQETMLHLRLGEQPGGADLDQPPRRDHPFRLRPPVLLGRLRARCRASTSIAGSPCSTSCPRGAARLHPCLVPAAEFDEARVEGTLALARERPGRRGPARQRTASRRSPRARPRAPNCGSTAARRAGSCGVCEAGSLADAEARFAALTVQEAGDGTLHRRTTRTTGPCASAPTASPRRKAAPISPADFTVKERRPAAPCGA